MTLMRPYFVLYSVCFQLLPIIGGFNSFMDSVYFDIKWSGPDVLKTTEEGQLNSDDSVLITTINNERYRCILPTVLEPDKTSTDDTSSAVFELDLLKPLFEQTGCTYRLETYWTYELCHGRHLRQYHEEKEAGKKPKIQEYFLGKYKMETFYASYDQAMQHRMKSDTKANERIQKVQGIEIPYYEVIYTDGTKCDLTGQPRQAFLHYVCQPEGRGEIYELKETSSCEYEVVVLSSQLCKHPLYGPKKEPLNTINCHALEGSPKRPLNLDIFELENSFEQFNSREDQDPINSLWDLVGQILVEQGLNDQFDHGDQRHHPHGHKPTAETERSFSNLPPPTDNYILKEFIEGSFCIEGGTGWWKHKFCYERQVVQFHNIDNARQDTIVLGEWSEEVHLRWIKENPWKKPKPLPERKHVNLYYGNGDICDLTGTRRSVEVRLRCISDSVHPNAVSIYLNEPKVCEYKLVVESSVFCDLIAQADDNGLIVNPKL